MTALDSIEILSFQNQRADYPVHYHETYCVSLVEQGVLGENELVVPSGSILVSHPYELHDNKSINDINYSFSTFYINQDVMNYISPFETTSFHDKVIVNELLYNQLAQLVQVSKLNGQRNKGPEEFSRAFVSVIHDLVAFYGNSIPLQVKETNQQLDEVKLYVRQHLHSKIDLTVLSNMFGMNKFKFIRWFKMNVGMTPFEYILLTRVGLGKVLIQEGLPLVQVALDAGFYDQSHFSNYFKRYIGLSPSAYRQSCNIFQDN